MLDSKYLQWYLIRCQNVAPAGQFLGRSSQHSVTLLTRRSTRLIFFPDAFSESMISLLLDGT